MSIFNIYQLKSDSKRVVVPNNKKNIKQKENKNTITKETISLAETTQEEYIKSKLSQISDKLRRGCELDSSELIFLKKHDPDKYDVAVEAQKRREEYRKRLENCKSKEEVEKLKATTDISYLSVIKGTSNNQSYSSETEKQVTYFNTIQNEHSIFKKTEKYKKLPHK